MDWIGVKISVVIFYGKIDNGEYNIVFLMFEKIVLVLKLKYKIYDDLLF